MLAHLEPEQREPSPTQFMAVLSSNFRGIAALASTGVKQGDASQLAAPKRFFRRPRMTRSVRSRWDAVRLK